MSPVIGAGSSPGATVRSQNRKTTTATRSLKKKRRAGKCALWSS
jgi:hypothetical protein